MKKFLFILLLPVAGISQSKTTTVYANDIYSEYNLYENRLNPSDKVPVKIKMYCGTPKSAGLMQPLRETRDCDSVTKGNHPLLIVNGCERDYSMMKLLSPSTIESINVLKSTSATEKYGAKAQYGVIIINLKSNTPIEPIKANILKPIPKP